MKESICELKQKCSNCGSVFNFDEKKLKGDMIPPYRIPEDLVDVVSCPTCHKDIVVRKHIFNDTGLEYERNKTVFTSPAMFFENERPNPDFGKTSVTLFKKKMEFVTVGFISECKKFKNRWSTRNYTWIAKTVIDLKNNVENILDVRR